jgi:uncharacterized protein DUF3383
MAAPALPISRLINVTVTLAPPVPQAENIDSCLLVGTSTVIDTVSRIRTYASLSAVAADFGTSAPEYLGADAWFSQSPQPQFLSIGRWVKTAAAGQLIGALLSAAQQAMTLWNAVTTPAFFLYEDGVPVTISPATLATAGNLNAVASIIQTALAANEVSTTCVWNSTYQNFTITSGTTGAASTVSFLAPPTAYGSATFSGQPTANDTLTLAGTAVTFVSGTPSGNQVKIGTSLTVTLANLLAFLNASVDTNIVKMTYSVLGSVLYCVSAVTGTAGNAYTLAKSSSAITLSGSTLSGGTGTDISGMLQMNASDSGCYQAPGLAAETALACVTLMDNQFPNLWYGLVVLSTADSDTLAIAGYIEGDSIKHYFGVTTQEAGVLVASDTTDIAYQLQQLGYNHTAVQYSSSSLYAVLSYLGRILTTNWQANNSTINLMYKQEPGIVAETLSQTQIAALEAKSCNVFVTYNNQTMIIERGTSASGQFTDTIVGLDWLATEMQNNLYTQLYDSPTKIPQTDAGMHVLATTIANTCVEAFNNGLLAPGIWNSGGFGSLQEGDNLPNGFYVYQPLVANQPQSARAARQSVPFQVAVKLAGAVDTVDCAILVNT